LIFDGFEILDLFGPLELFSLIPGCEIRLVSADGRPARSTGGVQTGADYSFATAPANPDVFLVPGGAGVRTAVTLPAYVDFVKRTSAGTTGITLSVCTGAALLAQAGILDGKRATTNKMVFSFPMQFGKDIDWVYHARWVEDGSVVTAAGVSAGIDAAAQVISRVWGADVARQSVNAAEYDWHTDANWDDFSALYPNPMQHA
ncbi:putative secreted protein, partial [Ramicandelaber brevisporus]